MKNQKIGRWLSEKNLKKLKNEYKFIIEYVKENADVLLGIRNEYINLYICGGSFLKLNLNNGKLSISTGYFKDEEKENKNSCDFDNKSIDEKKDELNKLKKIVSDYQKGITSKNKQGEKILQQNIVKAFNKKIVSILL